jgi:hypothetical protein
MDSLATLKTNDRSLKQLEFARYNDLKLANTYGPHKMDMAPPRWKTS